MVKGLIAILVLLAFAGLASAQSTNTSANVVDANSQAFSSGSYRIEFNANGKTAPFSWNGAPFNPQNYIFIGNLNGSGSLSGISIPSSNYISPTGTAWRFTVCPASSSPCYSTNITLQGAAEDVSSQITPPAISVNASNFNQPTAYQDSEIQGPTVGFIYFNLTSQTYRGCTVSVPCTWIGLGAGGGSVSDFSAGNLSPLFTTSVSNPTSSPDLSFLLSNADANTVFGNCTSSLAAPSYCGLTAAMLPGSGVTTINGTPCTVGSSCTPSGGGGVSSVGLTMPAEFNVANSPLTAPGTLAVTKANELPQTVWAGPLSASYANIVQVAKGLCDGCSPATVTINVTPGDLLIVFRSAHTLSAPTSSAGDTFTNAIPGPGNDVDTEIFYTCSAVGGTTTISQVTGGGYSAQIHVIEVSGAASSGCLDVTGTAGWDILSGMGYTTSVTTTSSGSVNQANELVVADFNSAQSTCTALSSGPGYSQLESSLSTSGVEANWPFMSEVLNSQSGLSGMQTATATCNSTGTQSWNGIIASFRLNTVALSAPPSFQSVATVFAASPLAKAVQAYNNCSMPTNLVVSSTGAKSVISCAVTMPSVGCPCRVAYNWSVSATLTTNASVEFWVTDGTSNFRASPVFGQTADPTGSAGSGVTSATYNSNVVVTLTLETQGAGSPSYTITAAPFVGAGGNSGMDVSALTSN